MDNNLTQEQFDNLKRELEQAGIPFDGSFLNPVNSNEYISSIFSHITIQEIEEKIANFQKIDLDSNYSANRTQSGRSATILE